MKAREAKELAEDSKVKRLYEAIKIAAMDGRIQIEVQELSDFLIEELRSDGYSVESWTASYPYNINYYVIKWD